MVRRPIVSLALVFAAAASLSAGTVIEPATLRALASDAALIVRGQVTEVRAFDAPRGIESVATVAVLRTIKGDAGPFVSVRVPGGVRGRTRRVTIGAPALRPHQHAVFFLVRGADNGWRPVGLSAGVLSIRQDASTGRLLVHPVVAPGRTTALGVVERGDPARRTLDLDEFEALLALVLAEPAVTFEWWSRP